MKRRMAILILMLSFLLLVNQACFAEITVDELDDYTVEELLALQEQISHLLKEKGYCVYTDISHGDKGDHVVRLQEKLKEYGYYNGKISGKYDTETEKAVKLFQKSNGLEVNGTATQAFQSFLFSSTQDSLITPTVATTPTPKPTEDPVLAEYEQISYSDYARYPEQYRGHKVELKGRVLQVIGTKNSGMSVRLDVGSGDVVYITIKKGMVDYNILDNDRLTVYGVLDGMYTYISTFMSSITIPCAKADIVILR